MKFYMAMPYYTTMSAVKLKSNMAAGLTLSGRNFPGRIIQEDGISG